MRKTTDPAFNKPLVGSFISFSVVISWRPKFLNESRPVAYFMKFDRACIIAITKKVIFYPN
jgi:hypothetical protein